MYNTNVSIVLLARVHASCSPLTCAVDLQAVSETADTVAPTAIASALDYSNGVLVISTSELLASGDDTKMWLSQTS